jgi:outer membrane PBP1 activator LpoA protein
MRSSAGGLADREESMRRLVLSVLAALVLTGCQSLYDDHAMDECDRTTRPGADRSDCYDRVEQNSREHRD